MFCNHIFQTDFRDAGFGGLISYGRQVLHGTHCKQTCKNCGKLRWKSYGWTVVSKRKTLEYPKQLTFN